MIKVTYISNLDISFYDIGRGQIRMGWTPMTESMYYLLVALLHPGHGYRLMQEIREVSGGRVQMGPGTLYGLLGRMLDDGLINVKEQVGTRKVYAITDRGKQALQEEYERLCRMVQDIQPFLGKGGKLP